MATTNNALYNRHRPTEFEDLVGQDHIVKVIKNDLNAKKLLHSIILVGQPGVGKTSMARIIANKLNPHKSGIIEKDSAIDGRIDCIRDLQIDVMHQPLEGDFKTYIFDEAQRITSQSFAALLKTIEEPPPHIKFIFVTTEIESVPDNIKSRSQIFKFKRLTNQEIRSKIEDIINKEKFKLNDNLIDISVEYGRGSLRNSIVALDTVVSSMEAGITEVDIASSLGILGSKKLSEVVESYINRDFMSLLNSVSLFKDDRTDPLQIVFDLQQFVMDCRLCLISKALINKTEMNTSYFFSFLKSKLSGKDANGCREAMKIYGRSLDKFYDLTLELEGLTRNTKNKDALLTRFVIKAITENA